jgi:hypothetical protein
VHPQATTPYRPGLTCRDGALVQMGGTGRGRASRCAGGDVGVGKGPWPGGPCDAHCGSARGVVWMPLGESWCDHVGEVCGEGVQALGGEEGSHVWRGPPSLPTWTRRTWNHLTWTRFCAAPGSLQFGDAARPGDLLCCAPPRKRAAGR